MSKNNAQVHSFSGEIDGTSLPKPKTTRLYKIWKGNNVIIYFPNSLYNLSSFIQLIQFLFMISMLFRYEFFCLSMI